MYYGHQVIAGIFFISSTTVLKKTNLKKGFSKSGGYPYTILFKDIESVHRCIESKYYHLFKIIYGVIPF